MRPKAESGGRLSHIPPPIHRLPVELLTEIFSDVAFLVHQTSTPTAWLDLLLVCKRWHTIACETSAFWRVIHVRPRLDGLSLCLHRASNTLIDLHFVGLPPATVATAVRLVAPHATRIRALHVQLDSAAPLTGLFAPGRMPALEELTLLPVDWRVKHELPLPFAAGAHPRLRALALSGVSVPCDPAFFARLRTLELHEHCCAVHGFTLDALVSALAAAAPHLEELDLSRFDPLMPPADDDTRQEQQRQEGVALPRLRSFYMDNTLPVTAWLLRQLLLPATAVLRLRVLLTPADVQRYPRADRLLAALVSPAIRAMLNKASALLVTLSPDHITIRIPTVGGGEGGFTDDRSLGRDVDVHTHVEVRGWRAQGVRLRDVLAVCAPPQLAHLTLTVAPSPEEDTGECAALLGAFPLLEALVVRVRAPAAVFKALTPGAGAAAARARGESVMCPLLRSVRVEGQEDPKALLEAVVGCLRARAERGGARLRGLYVICGAVARGELGKYRAALEGLVDQLELSTSSPWPYLG